MDKGLLSVHLSTTPFRGWTVDKPPRVRFLVMGLFIVIGLTFGQERMLFKDVPNL